jgi:hypothetical protein
VSQTGEIVAIILGLLNIVAILSVGAKFINRITERLNRIEYALYNDGQTGLVQEQQEQSKKIDSVIRNQQEMKIDLEVMKVRFSV